MTMQIAVIDPYLKSPSINCFNGLVDLLQKPLSYSQPSQFGIEAMVARRHKTHAYIVLGSASHVHENLPWHKPMAEFLLGELKSNKPILGCCFGHQIIAHAFGSKVEYFKDADTKLQGARNITIDQDFWNFKKGESFNLAVTHKQVVKTLGPGLKAVGAGLANDIIIHETLPFMGTQAHPEASAHFIGHDIENMSESDKLRVKEDGEKFIFRFFKHFNLI